MSEYEYCFKCVDKTWRPGDTRPPCDICGGKKRSRLLVCFPYSGAPCRPEKFTYVCAVLVDHRQAYAEHHEVLPFKNGNWWLQVHDLWLAALVRLVVKPRHGAGYAQILSQLLTPSSAHVEASFALGGYRALRAMVDVEARR
jgi:hypothetical protein